MALISRISLLDKDLNVIREIEYSKLPSISPIIRDILYQKYMPTQSYSESTDRFTYAAAVFINRSLPGVLGSLIEKDGTAEDQMAWHISHEKAFRSKYKPAVASVIKNFLSLNDKYASECRTEHYEQFNKVAEDISKIEEDCVYFKYESGSNGEVHSSLDEEHTITGIISWDYSLDIDSGHVLDAANDAEQE